MTQPYQLPPDFLSSPAPDVQKEVINFKKTKLPEYDGCYASILDNVLTAQECAQLLRAAEATSGGKWEQALINTGFNTQRLMTDIRDCGRIMWDDQAIMDKIWARCEPHVPELKTWQRFRKQKPYEMTRLNERMRFLKYEKGNYFRPHEDGAYATPGYAEISFITLHLYLNEADEESQLDGGATTFHCLDATERSYDVDPKVGRVLLFQHSMLLHSGAEVHSGVKYTLRTDLMYRKEE